METVASELIGDTFTSVAQLAEACRKDSPLWEEVGVLLKGPEITLANYDLPDYLDKDDHTRDAACRKWWAAEAVNLQQLVEIATGSRQVDGDGIQI